MPKRTQGDAIEVAVRVVREVIEPNAKAVDAEGRFPSEAIGALGRAGLLGLALPEAHGGLGLGPSAFSRVLEEVAAACASSGMVYLMHVCAGQVVAARPPLGAPELLADLASGRKLGTLAFSEVGSRSHFWAPVGHAVARGDRHLLSAEKSFVTSAGIADVIVASALSITSKGPTESTLYWVAKGDAGVSVGVPWQGLGLRGNASAPMTLTDVSLDLGRRLGADGEGFQIMMEVVLPWFQLGAASVSLGLSRAALASTLTHLKGAKLEHLGQSLRDLPTLRAQAARMQIGLDSSRALVGETARALETPGPETMKLVLESKAASGEMALQITDAAMRVCGGAAFAGRVASVERNFRDARASSVMAPSSDVLFELLGRSLVGLPLM